MQHFAKSNFFKHSYFPRTINKWNNLPATVQMSPSFYVFKNNTLNFIEVFLYIMYAFFWVMFISANCIIAVHDSMHYKKKISRQSHALSSNFGINCTRNFQSYTCIIYNCLLQLFPKSDPNLCNYLT